MTKYYLNYLEELESEAVFVLREVYAQFQNPVILFSGGKDSIVLAHLAKKAFYPAKIPFALMHIDTGHNFPGEGVESPSDDPLRRDENVFGGSGISRHAESGQGGGERLRA